MDNKQKFGAGLLRGLRLIKLTVDTALWVALGGLLVLFGLQFPHAATFDSLWLIRKLHLWGDPPLAGVASKFGWAWPSKEVSLVPIGGGFVVLAVGLAWDAVMMRLTRRVQKRFPPPEESLALSASDSSQGISLSSRLIALAAVSDKAAAKIQRRYLRVEQRLKDTKRRWCAFLSVGVVDPEDMKQGETPEKVTRSFKAYEKMLDEAFQLTGAWKVAWTPDGVMVCYLDVCQAVEAGQRVLRGLSEFNANVNELPHPFRICCGLNEGEVAIFEDSKLQKVADRVIDVAGHMQKRARPNTLWLSSEVFERLKAKPGFRPANAQVDGYSVFEWQV